MVTVMVTVTAQPGGRVAPGPQARTSSSPCTAQRRGASAPFYTFGERALRVSGKTFNFFKFKIQATELLSSSVTFKDVWRTYGEFVRPVPRSVLACVCARLLKAQTTERSSAEAERPASSPGAHGLPSRGLRCGEFTLSTRFHTGLWHLNVNCCDALLKPPV